MIEILLKILDRLIQIKKERSLKLHKQFTHIVEPIFFDLEKIHSDYLRMFTNASLRLQQNSGALLEVIQTLEVQRLEFEPVRTKLIATLSELNLELPSFTSPIKLESEIDRFVRAVLEYLPLGDIQSVGGGTGASSLLMDLKYFNSKDKSPLSSILLFFGLETESTDMSSHSTRILKWQPKSPSECIELYTNLQRDRWKRVCEALAIAKVEMTKRN